MQQRQNAVDIWAGFNDHDIADDQLFLSHTHQQIPEKNNVVVATSDQNELIISYKETFTSFLNLYYLKDPYSQRLT